MLLSLAVALALGACGGGEDEPAPPETGFAAALATVSDVEPLGTGFGWIDSARLRELGGGDAEIARAAGALGPGGRDVLERARSLGPTGIDPFAADGLLSVVTSYTLALRLDGVDPDRAEAAFTAAGAKRGRAGEWATFDLGPDWTIPLGTPLEPLGSLAARAATKPRSILLARSTLAREKALASSSPAIEASRVAAAADCLGDVVAARLVLDNHTHLPNSGPELLAFGVHPPGPGPPREVLCALGEPAEPVEFAEQALRTAFEPGARDGVSGEPIGDLVASAEVDGYEYDGLRVARAELTAPTGAEPGLLFAAFDRGSLLTYIGLQPPPKPD